MTTAVQAPTAPAALDLEARLALRAALMDHQLDTAAVAFEVNTAHIAGADPLPEISAPLRLTPTLAPSLQATPIADLLKRARQRIVADGWCRDAIFDEQGAVCPIRAIRLEASGNRRLADDACVLLLESIERSFPGTATIPSWNAGQTSAQPVLLQFDRAAQLAASRGL